MKLRIRHAALACAVVLAVSSVAPSRAQQAAPKPEAPKPDPDKVMRSLEQLLKSYEEENTALRARVEGLEAEVQKLKQSRAVQMVPPGQPQGQVPPGWVPREFNGLTYYVVPLDGAGAGARAGAGVAAGTGAIRLDQGTIVSAAKPTQAKPVQATPTQAKPPQAK